MRTGQDYKVKVISQNPVACHLIFDIVQFRSFEVTPVRVIMRDKVKYNRTTDQFSSV